MAENYDKKRIAKNSALLYLRMLITVWFNLLTTRLVLKNLGVDDMGVYNVVGSLVSMCATFTGGLSVAVMRFLTFEMGKEDGNVNKVFCSCLNIILVSCFILIAVIESIGILVFNNYLNIPVDVHDTALWIYQFSAITCILNLITIPYNALIIAHERMNAFALISIIQVILNCAVAYSLSYFPTNRLIVYSILMTINALIIQLMYQLYSRHYFPESKFKIIIDWNTMRQVMKFTGVSTSSGILQMIIGQGITLVINWTFGVALNAVYAISLQLKNMVLSFAQNIFKAISPQITKTYAEGNFVAHRKLVYLGSKMEIYMILFILIPFMYRTEYIMQLWLGSVPDYAVSFVRCTIFLSLTYAAFEPIRTAVLATERIVKFMIIPDTLNLFVLPIAFIVAKYFDSPDLMILVIVQFEVMTCVLRLWYGTKVSEVTMQGTMKQVVFPTTCVAIVSSIICYIFSICTKETIFGLFLLLTLNSLSLLLVIYFLGIEKNERLTINKIITNRITRKKL